MQRSTELIIQQVGEAKNLVFFKKKTIPEDSDTIFQ